MHLGKTDCIRVLTEKNGKRSDEETDVGSVGTSGYEEGSRQAKHLIHKEAFVLL